MGKGILKRLSKREPHGVKAHCLQIRSGVVGGKGEKQSTEAEVVGQSPLERNRWFGQTGSVLKELLVKLEWSYVVTSYVTGASDPHLPRPAGAQCNQVHLMVGKDTRIWE